MLSARTWLAPASAVAVVAAVAVGAWAVLHVPSAGGTGAGPARTSPAAPSTRDFLTGQGAPAVAFDDGVDQVLTAVGQGSRACADEAGRLGTTLEILAVARQSDPSLASFARVSDRLCEGSYVAAWIDQSASGMAVLLHREGSQFAVVAMGSSPCANPAVQARTAAVRQFFGC